jgi:large subunit ribosomal protein L6
MSRIGSKVITLPKNIKFSVLSGLVSIEGPLGKLQLELPEQLTLTDDNSQIFVTLTSQNPTRQDYAQQGLFRSLIANMVKGVTDGFAKKLELIGVGYRASVQGDILDLSLGFSHPVKLQIPTGIKVAVEKNTLVTISGFDKHLLGQFAANVRSKRPPEPYQGKGIRYANEYVRRKAGKTGKGGKK